MKIFRHNIPAASSIAWIAWLSLSAVALYATWLSFKSTNVADASYMYYNAWLINEQGFSPYKNIMETSFPGTFLAYCLITKIFGYTDLSFHIADMTILALLLAATWLMMKPLGILPAIFAVILYAVYYSGTKDSMHLQRDYLGILPIVISIILMRNQTYSLYIRSLFIGFLFGISISIKPQLGIGLPIVAASLSLMNTQNNIKTQNTIYYLLPLVIGLLIYLGGLAIWLYANKSLGYFIDMIKNYLPLYLTGEDSSAPIWEKAYQFFKDNFYPFLQMSTLSLLTAVGGLIWQLTSNDSAREKIYSITIFLMIPAYAVSAVSGLRLWDYHAMPMDYFAIAVGCLIFKKNYLPSRKRKIARALLQVMFVLNAAIMGLGSNLNVIKQLNDMPPPNPSGNNAITDYLKDVDHSNNKIQLIVANTNGPFFSALLSEQFVMATAYPLCWFCSKPANNQAEKNLQEEFSNQLQKSLPPIIIIDKNFSEGPGIDNFNSYPGLKNILLNNYNGTYYTGYFSVYKKTNSNTPPPTESMQNRF